MKPVCECTSTTNNEMVLPIDELLSAIAPMAFDKLSYATKKDNEIHFSKLSSHSFLVGVTYAKRNDAYKLWMFDELRMAKIEPLFDSIALPINNNSKGNIPGKGFYVKSAQECANVIMKIYYM